MAISFQLQHYSQNDRRIYLRIREVGNVKRLGGIKIGSRKFSLIQMKDCPKFCRTDHGHSRQVCLGELTASSTPEFERIASEGIRPLWKGQ